jgi:hypothetical protein
VRIFEPSGRIVATLANEAQASASVREFRVGSAGSGRVAPASGVYFYRIEAEEGTLTGRFVVIK